jgi:hypothetical protein
MLIGKIIYKYTIEKKFDFFVKRDRHGDQQMI